MIACLLFLFSLTDPLLSVKTSGRQAPGYFLVSGVRSDSVGCIDNSGYFVHGISSGPNINQTPTPYRGYTYFDGLTGVFIHVDNTLHQRDTIAVTPPYTTDFHEGYITRNRRSIVLGREERTVDLSQTIQGASDSAVVLGAVIQEFDRWGRVTFQWRSLDHIPVTETTYDIDVTHNRIDYIHANAVIEDQDGNFILSCRNLDQIIKIDRLSGAVLWRLGGSAAQRNDFEFVNDTIDGYAGFSHQHTPILTREGELMVFDNGCLNPRQISRIVAYRLDVTTMRATKTWEYYPEEPYAFSPTMGSIQQLSNGNILIGWGTTQYRTIASEVDRQGVVHASLESTTPLGFPYRVYKSTVGMTAVTRTVTSARAVDFSDADSTTRFTILPTPVNDTTRVAIEHHTYPPHHQDFAEAVPCYVLPDRWVIATTSTTPLEATIDVSRTIAEDNPEAVIVYYRPHEGTGFFQVLPSSTTPSSSSIVVRGIQPGEYMLGTKLCNQPALVYPTNFSDDATASTPLRWTGVIGADGYEVEISTDSTFMADVQFLRTTHPDTLLKNLKPNTTYYWHVRVIRQPEVGTWTTTWTFTTMAPSSIAHQEAEPDIPVGSFIVIYDVLGNIVARERIERAQQQPAPDIKDKLLFVIATTPSGATLRRVIYR